MRPRRLLAVGLAGLAAGAATLPAPEEAGAARCSAAPAKLSFERSPGRVTGRLSWRAPRGGARRYRVYRNRAVVGQTTARSIAVTVRPGRRYRFAVRAVTAGGQPVGCAAELRTFVRWYAPRAPRALAVASTSGNEVELTWSAARRGDGRIAGYRIYRDGEVDRQTRSRRASVRTTPGRDQLIQVAAVDTRGKVGRRSGGVTVRTDHSAPGAPATLGATATSDTTVALTWAAAEAGSAPLAGYRIYRDGQLLRQVEATAEAVTNLAPATAYRFTVAAVDSAGYLGPETAAATATTHNPAPTTGNVHAFLLASTDQSFKDFQAHYRQIGTVYPTYYECEPDGSIAGRDDPLITGWARLRKVAVLPRINCQSQSRLHLILTDAAARARTLDRLTELASHPSYDGLNLDFESGAATDRAALTSFVEDLADRLHALGKRISVEVSAKTQETTTGRSGFYDYRTLGAAADTVFVMDWGIHWSTSTPGAIDDLPWATDVADYVATMPNKHRYVLGLGLYGLDWPAGGGPSNPATPLEYADVMDLAARTGSTPTVDPTARSPHFSYTDAAGVAHEVWYQDATSAALRIRVARERGLGVGFWRLGREDQAIWSNPLLP